MCVPSGYERLPQPRFHGIPEVVPFDYNPDSILSRNRKGFIIRHSSIPLAYVSCYEGYILQQGPETADDIVEPHVLDLALANVPHNENGRGIGTSFINEAIAEAKRRSFQYVRAVIENPKIVHIFEKALLSRLVTNTAYLLSATDSEYLPTQTVLHHPETITSDMATEYLNSLPKYDAQTGSVEYGHGRIEAILSLD